jgi:hypothetical protein
VSRGCRLTCDDDLVEWAAEPSALITLAKKGKRREAALYGADS